MASKYGVYMKTGYWGLKITEKRTNAFKDILKQTWRASQVVQWLRLHLTSRKCGSDPWVWRSPGEGNGNPTHSGILIREIPWTEEPGALPSMGSQRVRHDWATEHLSKAGRNPRNPQSRLEKTLEHPLDCKEIQPVHPKGDQSWVFIGKTDVEAETPILWPPHVKSWLIGKDPDAGKDWGQEEKGVVEDEMVGWYHWLNGRESEWTLGFGDGQGGLVCCNSWGRKKLHRIERLNWTEPASQNIKQNRKEWDLSPTEEWGYLPIVCLSTYELRGVWTRRWLEMNGLVQIKAARMFFLFCHCCSEIAIIWTPNLLARVHTRMSTARMHI